MTAWTMASALTVMRVTSDEPLQLAKQSAAAKHRLAATRESLDLPNEKGGDR